MFFLILLIVIIVVALFIAVYLTMKINNTNVIIKNFIKT